MYHNNYADTETLQAFLTMPRAEGVQNGVSFLGNEWSLYDLYRWFESATRADWQRRYRAELLEVERSDARTQALLDAMSLLLGIPAVTAVAQPLMDAQGTIGTPQQWAERSQSQYERGTEVRRVLNAMKAQHGEDHPLMQLYYQEGWLARQREQHLHRLSQIARYADDTVKFPAVERIEPRHIQYKEEMPPASQAELEPDKSELTENEDWETL